MKPFLILITAILPFLALAQLPQATQNPTFKKVTGQWFMAGAPENYIELRQDSIFVEKVIGPGSEIQIDNPAGNTDLNTGKPIPPARFRVTGNKITLSYANGNLVMFEYYYDLKLKEWGIKREADDAGAVVYYFKHKYK